MSRGRLLVAAGAALVVAVLVVALLAAVRGPGDDHRPAAGPPPAPGTADPAAGSAEPPGGTRGEALAPAVDRPREDPVYPAVGDPSVDALHYDLVLDWDPAARVLDAAATVTFRATVDGDEVRLDLGEPLGVTAARLDGREVEVDHTGKDLRVLAPFRAGDVHALELTYTGTPQPVPAPTTRTDFATTGWTVTEEGEVWTMQEPYGAYSWYPVNDHPSDKAFYDVTVTTPAPFRGVANGRLVEHATSDGVTTSRWELDSPAAAYLVTVAIGDYVEHRPASTSGVPLSVWTLRGDARGARRMTAALPAALRWAERRLGPYPFSSLGVVLTDSDSGMETQTMITLGANDYVQSLDVVLHEVVHQWWGDQVTPTDWRDLWMNEGMAMYLQGVHRAEATGTPLATVVAQWAAREPVLRADFGPPAAYDPHAFGESNVYYGGALLWHEVRRRVGDRRFWRLVRAWPQARDRDHGTAAQLERFTERSTGAELSGLFAAWLHAPRSPVG